MTKSEINYRQTWRFEQDMGATEGMRQSRKQLAPLSGDTWTLICRIHDEGYSYALLTKEEGLSHYFINGRQEASYRKPEIVDFSDNLRHYSYKTEQGVVVDGKIRDEINDAFFFEDELVVTIRQPNGRLRISAPEWDSRYNYSMGLQKNPHSEAYVYCGYDDRSNHYVLSNDEPLFEGIAYELQISSETGGVSFIGYPHGGDQGYLYLAGKQCEPIPGEYTPLSLFVSADEQAFSYCYYDDRAKRIMLIHNSQTVDHPWKAIDAESPIYLAQTQSISRIMARNDGRHDLLAGESILLTADGLSGNRYNVACKKHACIFEACNQSGIWVNHEKVVCDGRIEKYALTVSNQGAVGYISRGRTKKRVYRIHVNHEIINEHEWCCGQRDFFEGGPFFSKTGTEMIYFSVDEQSVYFNTVQLEM